MNYYLAVWWQSNGLEIIRDKLFQEFPTYINIGTYIDNIFHFAVGRKLRR